MGIMKREIERRLNNRRKSSGSKNLPFEISIESISESDKFTRSQDKERQQQFNADVKEWGQSTTRELKISVGSLIYEDRRLSTSIKSNVYYDRKYAKEASRVSFSFAREGIYAHKGAGRGQGGYKGSKWYNSKGELKETDPASLGLMDQGNRKAIEWFDPVVEKELVQLVDIVGEYSSNLIMDASRIFIDK